MKTPPPFEKLLMPVMRLQTPDVQLTFKYDFGVYPEAWTVSMSSGIDTAPTTLGLFDPGRDLRTKVIAGFQQEWIYGPYNENPNQFTCEVQDEWDLACLFRVVFSGRKGGELIGPRLGWDAGGSQTRESVNSPRHT